MAVEALVDYYIYVLPVICNSCYLLQEVDLLSFTNSLSHLLFGLWDASYKCSLIILCVFCKALDLFLFAVLFEIF